MLSKVGLTAIVTLFLFFVIGGFANTSLKDTDCHEPLVYISVIMIAISMVVAIVCVYVSIWTT